MSETNQMEAERGATENQVIPYEAPWNIFAVAFSNTPQYPFRMGVASFLAETTNYVEIIQLNQQRKFQKKVTFEHRYPPTKILFNPDLTGTSPDLIATSGENLKIYEINNNQEVKMRLNLKNENQFCAPLTSFDWNPQKINLIGTSSIDTTCSIWDIEKGSVYTQLIAHDKEVYDIHFSKNKDIFASVGADGSVRQFDTRDLKHSSVLYESEKARPILKLAWNRKQPSTNLLAVIEMEQHYITLIDARKPSVPYCKLRNHKECVNAIAWAPQSSFHICSVGDDCKAYIWDLNGDRPENYQLPLLDKFNMVGAAERMVRHMFPEAAPNFKIVIKFAKNIFELMNSSYYNPSSKVIQLSSDGALKKRRDDADYFCLDGSFNIYIY